MLNQREATAIVEREIANFEPLPAGDSWVIYHERTVARDFGWVFFYGSRLYAETGEVRYAVAGNAPFLFNRHTRAVVPTGTAHAVEHYIAEYETHLAQRHT